MSYRVGNHQRRNLYRGDQYIGVCFDPADTALIVDALEGHLPTLDSAIRAVGLCPDRAEHHLVSACRACPYTQLARSEDGLGIGPGCSLHGGIARGTKDGGTEWISCAPDVCGHPAYDGPQPLKPATEPVSQADLAALAGILDSRVHAVSVRLADEDGDAPCDCRVDESSLNRLQVHTCGRTPPGTPSAPVTAERGAVQGAGRAEAAEALRTAVRRVTAARPGVEPSAAHAVIEVLLVMGWTPPAETVGDSCSCTVAGTDPGCVVHHGRRARGPKPPPVGPGCICDGSGRDCPRHGVVL